MEIIRGFKFLLQSVIVLLLALIVTFWIKFIGIIYAFVWLFHNPKLVLKFYDNYFGGLLQNTAWIITKFAIYLDMLWNIGGSSEALEDFITYKEASYFNRPLTTVSSSIGKTEIDKQLIPKGKWFSILLNKVFSEKSHAKSSYLKEQLINDFNMSHFGTKNRLM